MVVVVVRVFPLVRLPLVIFPHISHMLYLIFRRIIGQRGIVAVIFRRFLCSITMIHDSNRD